MDVLVSVVGMNLIQSTLDTVVVIFSVPLKLFFSSRYHTLLSFYFRQNNFVPVPLSHDGHNGSTSLHCNLVCSSFKGTFVVVVNQSTFFANSPVLQSVLIQLSWSNYLKSNQLSKIDPIIQN